MHETSESHGSEWTRNYHRSVEGYERYRTHTRETCQVKMNFFLHLLPFQRRRRNQSLLEILLFCLFHRKERDFVTLFLFVFRKGSQLMITYRDCVQKANGSMFPIFF